MKEFIAAGAQIAVDPMNIEANIEKCLIYLRDAVEKHHAELVVFPETVTTGFTPDVSVEALYDMLDVIPGRLTAAVQALAKELGVYVVWPTYERGPQRPVVYNSAALIGRNGEILDVYRKTHPFPTERIEGGGWCTAGDRVVVVETDIAKIGIMICYDGDFPELSRVMALQGAEVIVRPSALLRSYPIWDLTNSARAYDNHVYLIGVNAIGTDAKQNFYFGNSMIVDPIAWKLAQARGQEEIISARLHPDPLRYVTHGAQSEMIFDHLEDRNVGVYGDILTEAKSPFEPAKRIPYRKVTVGQAGSQS